jgi:hypothetical protein
MNPTRLGASSTFPGSGTYQFTFKFGEAAKNGKQQSAVRGSYLPKHRPVNETRLQPWRQRREY